MRVEIVKDSYVCDGITAGTLFALCEKLIAAGHDPATALEAWRGEMLCLKVRSIGEGARLRVSPHGTGFVAERPGASPIAELLTPAAQAAAVRKVSPASLSFNPSGFSLTERQLP
jgi:hypothetical protein